MHVRFDGIAPLPAWTATPLTLLAPFTFFGLFSFATGDGANYRAFSHELFGFGIAHLLLQPVDDDLPAWYVASVDYTYGLSDTTEALVVTPEPGTLLLVGSVLLLGGWRHRKRTAAGRSAHTEAPSHELRTGR